MGGREASTRLFDTHDAARAFLGEIMPFEQRLPYVNNFTRFLWIRRKLQAQLPNFVRLMKYLDDGRFQIVVPSGDGLWHMSSERVITSDEATLTYINLVLIDL